MTPGGSRPDTTDDGFLGGRLRIHQPRSGHRAGHDAMLLAAATAAEPGQRVADLGAGVGAAGLALATRVAGLDLTLVEIDHALAELAQENARRNDVKARAVVLDVSGPAESFAAAGLAPDSLDIVMMNPPFNHPGRHQASPDVSRKVAHAADERTLEVWVHAARRMLKSGGTLVLIWRAEGLADVLAALSRGFGSVSVMPVHPRAGEGAIRILVGAVKGARAPLVLLPGLDLEGDAASAALQGEGTLRLIK
jgi:tRNA1(Val) A37 N6-methylase TrmN6